MAGIALKLRTKLQAIFFKLGCFSQRFSWVTLATGFLILIGFSFGLLKARIETDVEKLWMEVDGRLEKELQYTKDSLGEGHEKTNELIIHASNNGEGNILSVASLQNHLKAVQKAIDIRVTIYNKTWTHSDLCYAPEVPSFNNSLVDGIVAAIIPCLIVSPLDCFWDGAKVLKLRGTLPDIVKSFPLEWTKSHPSTLLGLLPLLQIEGEEEIRQLFFKAGIVDGYQNRPCLDPTEADCPNSAPNSPSKSGQELTGGCKGFATEFMQWAEELVVGGTDKVNGTLSSAKALQTIIVLSSPQDLQKRFADKSQHLTVDWNISSARKVLEAWQRSFTEELNKDVNNRDDFSIMAFDSASVTDLLVEFSQTSLIYAGLTLKRWCNAVHSHGALGFAGVLIVTLSVAAGLGFCALVRIPFNAASTQVLPFLALGLGVDDMFLLAHSYSFQTQNGDIRNKEEVGLCLATTGVSVFLTSFNNMLAFFMAALIPIPALRYFAIQAAVVVVFNFIAVIIIFPAIISLDLRRRKVERYDVVCCLKRSRDVGREVDVLSTDDLSSTDGQSNATSKTEISGSQVTGRPSQTMVMSETTKDKSDSSIAEVLAKDYVMNDDKHWKGSLDNQGTQVNSNAMQITAFPRNTNPPKGRGGAHDNMCSRLSLDYFASVYYGPFLQETPVKVVVIVLFAGLLAVGIYGSFQVDDGLEVKDVVPQGSVAHQFVEAQFKYFSFYPMALVTQADFDYANRQKILYSYHEAFKEIPNVIRIPDSEEIPNITYSGWYENASDSGIVAFKLLAQAGNGGTIDRSKVRNVTLVSDDGIIPPDLFYKALTAEIRPKTLGWSNTRIPQDHAAIQVPTAKPISFAKINFNVIDLRETKDFVNLIKSVRAICENFSAEGLPNYPSGVPFTFWEQYIELRKQILMAIGISLAVSFVVMSAMLLNIWAAGIIVISLIMITVELYGFMGLVGIQLSAVPAVTLILSVGVGEEFTVHMCMAFLYTPGDRNDRMLNAVKLVFAPIINGAVSTFLGVVMLAGSPFQFVVRYFFNLLVALILIGTLNGLLLLPVLLSIIGPGAVA
ncbi:Protein patched-like protein 1 [Acropora cervicornis]|uniref:Protein patched-like protein 1 n=1 Tax=Acropora cervicornis TaxID=6130 RepID=A0AAD9QZF9_ACRCE|nr:Protein patched-like protein 1 [Acropora cervicornis]